jgi:diguanylate cyclase (GGDEF)-like protein
MARDAVNVYPRVEREIIGCLAKISPDPQLIDEKVSRLEEDLGIKVYSELLHLLCHLDFPPAQAKLHWHRVLRHRDTLSEKLGQLVDFRVALLDYFITVNQHFQNPKIIEIKIFKKTQDSAMRDELTGLHNYRHFRAELDLEFKRSKRGAKSLSLCIFDVDHFKWYNDRNGHLEGDKALKTVARLVRGEVRQCDVVARYGGEEFVVLLPGASKPKAFAIAQRIRERVAAHAFPFGEHQPASRLTVSGGVATYRADAETPTALIEAADRALYLAKGSGKDRVLTAGLESREHHRFKAEIPGRLQFLSEHALPFQTQNLSEQGLQFRCEKALAAGEYFRFTLSLPDRGPEVEGVARTVRALEVEQGFEIGAEIVEIAFHHAQVLREFLDRKGVKLEESIVESR